MQIVVVGVGNMGGAILSRLKEKFDAVGTNSNSDQDMTGKVLILAVKPQSFADVVIRGTPKAVISIMAGVKLGLIREKIASDFYIRAMPNLAALYGKSATAFTGDQSFKSEAEKILQSFGSAVWLDNEDKLDIATALAGSGPGFLAVIAESMANSATALGLSAKDAHSLTKALFDGMGDLLSDHPALLKEKITSPAGTTAAGIKALEENGVRNAIYQAVEKAYKRAKELS